MKRNKPKPRSTLRTEHAFRPGGLPPKLGHQNEGIRWAPAYRKLMTTMAQTHRRAKAQKARKAYRNSPFLQQVAVRVSYNQRKRAGQSFAHGIYIGRESAGAGPGFDESGPVLIAKKLDGWQKAGDELLWKVIVSPERGSDLDLELFTRNLLAQMEKDLNLKLEWVAKVHTDTEFHHVHVAIRGVDKDGKRVVFPREFVKKGIRTRAQELATAKLGHRLEQDIVVAQQKMVRQPRFTDLDRAILKRVGSGVNGGVGEGKDGYGWGVKMGTDGDVYINPSLSKGLRRSTEECCVERLAYLESIGLAKPTGAHSWEVSPGMEPALREIAKTHDRQRMMDQFGVLASDPATPIDISHWRSIDKLEGRILVHGEEDLARRPYMLVEDVGGVIRMLEHRSEIDALRRLGQLQPGSYISGRVMFTGPKKVTWKFEDRGPAEDLLLNKDAVSECLARGVDPPNHKLGGWLGRFREEIQKARGGRETPPKHHQNTTKTPPISPQPRSRKK